MEYPSRESMAIIRSIFVEFSRLKHYEAIPVSNYGGSCMPMILNDREFVFIHLYRHETYPNYAVKHVYSVLKLMLCIRL